MAKAKFIRNNTFQKKKRCCSTAFFLGRLPQSFRSNHLLTRFAAMLAMNEIKKFIKNTFLTSFQKRREEDSKNIISQESSLGDARLQSLHNFFKSAI
jgi:hypothetical protein